jgi:MtN3 and saliva related transmembrane protein
MDTLNLLGLAAGTLTTVSFLPQVIKTWRSKSCRDISLVMFSVLALGVSLWIVYGFMMHAWPVLAANAATLVLVMIILYFKITCK